jgi:hypothetical protein
MDELIHQIGLLLSQLRVARRAIEDIERSTARYNSFAFASALSAGAKFGEPPMFGGALKVWIVNINDLAPGAGGGFLQQLLGGIGSFFGNFTGAVPGSLLASLSLPGMISNLQKIADSVERILIRLGINMNDKDKNKDDKSKEPTGPSLIDTLNGWKDVFNVFTALFLAAGKDPAEAQKTSDSRSAGAQQWLAILQSASALVDGIDRVVRGLTLLIPIVIGALAELITQLGRIKLELIDLVQFVLQEVFLLRGVILVTIYDTLAVVARVAASVLGILSVGLASMADSIFTIFSFVFEGVIAAIRTLADGLQTTVSKVASWLVDVIGGALGTIGDSLVFQQIAYTIRVLPDILPHLVVALQGEGALSNLSEEKLKAARGVPLPDFGAKGLSGADLPLPPLISASLLPGQDYQKLTKSVTEAIHGSQREFRSTFDIATGTLNGISKQLDDAAKDKDFAGALKSHTTDLQNSSKTLAGALADSQKAAEAAAAEGHPASGLETIAKAYEQWLTEGGLKDVLTYVTDYFKKPGAADAIKDQAVAPTAVTQPRATVDIQDMIIEIQAPPDTSDSDVDHDKKPEVHADDLMKVLKEMFHDFSERGLPWDSLL